MGAIEVTQEMLAYQYHQSYGIKSIVSRGFNHSGPRRGENFVDSSFAKQIAKITCARSEGCVHDESAALCEQTC